MFFDLTRRRLLGVTGTVISAVAVSTVARGQGKEDLLSRTLRDLETQLGARLGAAILDTETGHAWRNRAGERFPLNSTFKAFACAAVLARVDAGQDNLARRIIFQKSDLVAYSPITETRIGDAGMTLGEICAAAMTTSDNTAGNLIIDSLGGPQGVTHFMRTIGDNVTRLDRREPYLNEAIPDDPRDTTTPNAIARSLSNLVTSNALSSGSRKQLVDWLTGNTVGGPLLRAGLPTDWRIADRTGAGGHGSRGIVAVIWPPLRKPIVATVFITETTASMDARNAAIADIGRALARTIRS